MNYEVLETTPLSGGSEERHFGGTDVKPLWIRFHPDASEDWLGSFACGNLGLVNLKIAIIANTPKVAILHNGAFYLIDSETRDLLCKPDTSYYNDFMAEPSGNQVFLASYCGVTVVRGVTATRIPSPGLIDGIRLHRIENGLLLGEYYVPTEDIGWDEFEIDTSTLAADWKGKFHWCLPR
jgi:hypothetical protein